MNARPRRSRHRRSTRLGRSTSAIGYSSGWPGYGIPSPLRRWRRLVPAHVGAEESILEFGALHLTASQGLHLLGGGLLALELWNDLDGTSPVLRQVVAGLCLLAGLLGALVRIDGKPLLVWLLVGISHLRFPRAAIWQLQPQPVREDPAPAWVEITRPLCWPTGDRRT